jgi:hypothetical protein
MSLSFEFEVVSWLAVVTHVAEVMVALYEQAQVHTLDDEKHIISILTVASLLPAWEWDHLTHDHTGLGQFQFCITLSWPVDSRTKIKELYEVTGFWRWFVKKPKAQCYSLHIPVLCVFCFASLALIHALAMLWTKSCVNSPLALKRQKLCWVYTLSPDPHSSSSWD